MNRMGHEAAPTHPQGDQVGWGGGDGVVGGGVYREWVVECWHDTYEGAAGDGRSPGDAACPRGLRGGSWNSRMAHLPCAYRIAFDTVKRLDVVGFRVMCSSRSY